MEARPGWEAGRRRLEGQRDNEAPQFMTAAASKRRLAVDWAPPAGTRPSGQRGQISSSGSDNLASAQ